MKLFIAGTALGLAVGLLATGKAQEAPTEDTTAAANEAGLDPIAVQGALNSQPGIDARTYLTAIGALVVAVSDAPAKGVSNAGVRTSHPVASAGWPIGGALGQRLYCIEGIESHHGIAMYNPTPVGVEHAQGYLGWLPSTARSVDVVIGNRASEWAGGARMLAAGRGPEFYGIRAGLC